MHGARRRPNRRRSALTEYKAQLAEGLGGVREDPRRGQEPGVVQILAEMREQATRESTRIVENARTQIEAERTQVIGQLKTEVGGLATTLAGRIVGESPRMTPEPAPRSTGSSVSSSPVRFMRTRRSDDAECDPGGPPE